MIKKILSKDERDKKTQRNQILIGVILIGLMLLSTLGYALGGNEKDNSNQKVSYNGIDFTRNLDDWIFSSNGYNFNTRYNPEETKNISVNLQTYLEGYKGKPLYFVTESGQPNIEIYRNLGKDIIMRVQNACLEDTNCTKKELPLKNCYTDNIIVIRQPKNNESEKIYQSNKCVYIIASDNNETLYSDAFLFKILNI